MKEEHWPALSLAVVYICGGDMFIDCVLEALPAAKASSAPDWCKTDLELFKEHVVLRVKV